MGVQRCWRLCSRPIDAGVSPTYSERVSPWWSSREPLERGASAVGALTLTFADCLQDHPAASLGHYEAIPSTWEYVEAGDGTVGVR